MKKILTVLLVLVMGIATSACTAVNTGSGQSDVDYVKEKADKFKKGAVVVDCGGTKINVCRELYPVADEHGFEFIGGHPMAGTQFSGFRHSRANLYKGATMLLAPQSSASIPTREKPSPPSTPSMVLLGLTTGASLCLPKRRPIK